MLSFLWPDIKISLGWGGYPPLINLIGYLGLGWGVLGLRLGVPPMGGWVPPPPPRFSFFVIVSSKKYSVHPCDICEFYQIYTRTPRNMQLNANENAMDLGTENYNPPRPYKKSIPIQDWARDEMQILTAGYVGDREKIA